MNNAQPLVSVCVTTYQHVNYIIQCLDGILMQRTSFPFEIILGDDESDDGTRDICIAYANRYPDKIKLFLRYRKDVIYINGQATGRYNFIENLKQCRGKYIALCEGDDYWTDPLKLQKQVDFLESNQDFVLCFHDTSILNPNGQIVKDYITNVPENYEALETFVRFGNYMHTPSVMFRNILKKFPFEFDKVAFGDFFLYFMLGHHGKFKHLEEIMSVYREGIGLISNMSEKDMTINYVGLYSCMVSFTTNEALKALILEKQKEIVSSYFYLVEDKYWLLKKEQKEAFMSHHQFFKWLKYVQTTYWKLKNKQSE